MLTSQRMSLVTFVPKSSPSNLPQGMSLFFVFVLVDVIRSDGPCSICSWSSLAIKTSVFYPEWRQFSSRSALCWDGSALPMTWQLCALYTLGLRYRNITFPVLTWQLCALYMLELRYLDITLFLGRSFRLEFSASRDPTHLVSHCIWDCSGGPSVYFKA